MKQNCETFRIGKPAIAKRESFKLRQKLLMLKRKTKTVYMTFVSIYICFSFINKNQQ